MNTTRYFAATPLMLCGAILMRSPAWAANVSAPQPTVTYTKVTVFFTDAGQNDAFDRAQTAVGVNENGSRSVMANLTPSQIDQGVLFQSSVAVTVAPTQTQMSGLIGLTGGNTQQPIDIAADFLYQNQNTLQDVATHDLTGEVFKPASRQLLVWVVQDADGFLTPITTATASQDVSAALPYWTSQANVNFSMAPAAVAISTVELNLATTPFDVVANANKFPVSQGSYNVFFVPSLLPPSGGGTTFGRVDDIGGQRAFIAVNSGNLNFPNTIAHELGHLLGLSHVGSSDDPTSWTYTDPNTGQQVSSSYRLMFWNHDGRSASIVPSEGLIANP
jgi:hypothetical protein